MKQEYSAGGVVYRQNQQNTEILFILDPYNEWAFPKGHIEAGEKAEQAALREIEEETGIKASDLEVVENLGTMEYQFTLGKQKINKLVNFYLMKVEFSVKAEPQKNEGISQIKWVEINKAPDFSGYENTGKVLQKAIKYLDNSIDVVAAN